jgi:predicted Zn-dependent protease with MMP-like domain
MHGRWGKFVVNSKLRARFDRILENVLQELPATVRRLLDEVPLHVEDYPSRTTMKETGIQSRDELCGLYSGVPLTERGSEGPQPLPDFVTIYREGILAQATDDAGHVSVKTLQEEIRKTILHEVAHYHGLEEEELWKLGYG